MSYFTPEERDALVAADKEARANREDDQRLLRGKLLDPYAGELDDLTRAKLFADLREAREPVWVGGPARDENGKLLPNDGTALADAKAALTAVVATADEEEPYWRGETAARPPTRDVALEQADRRALADKIGILEVRQREKDGRTEKAAQEALDKYFQKTG